MVDRTYLNDWSARAKSDKKILKQRNTEYGLHAAKGSIPFHEGLWLSGGLLASPTVSKIDQGCNQYYG